MLVVKCVLNITAERLAIFLNYSNCDIIYKKDYFYEDRFETCEY